MSRLPRSTILSEVLRALRPGGGGYAIAETSALRDLTREPVYAIPERFFDSLNSLANNRRELFSPTEIDLERRFGRLCHHLGMVAVFHCKFAQHLLLGQSAALSEEMFHERGWHNSLSYVSYQSNLCVGQTLMEPVHEQLEAYLGWLMTWRPFLAERDALQAKWREEVDVMGRIPRRPVAAFVELAASALSEINFDRDELIADFTSFYDRWNLTALVTWDLPEPIGANLGAPASVGRLVGVEERPALQLSPTIRLPLNYPIRKLVQSPPGNHLADWQAVLDERHPDGLGYERFRRIFHFHFLRNVVLPSCYGDRFHRSTGHLDWILASYFGDKSDETCRKLRLYINSRLNSQTNS